MPLDDRADRCRNGLQTHVPNVASARAPGACRRNTLPLSPQQPRDRSLLLPVAAGPEQKLERRSRRSLAWPVVYVVGVDRLGRRFHALVTGSAAGGLGIQPVARRLTYGRVEPTRSLGIRRRAAPIHGGATRAVGCRAAARRHGPGLSLRRTWQAGSSTVPMLARRAPSASAS